MPLEATIDAVAKDDVVEFVFHVVNASEEPVELTFRSGKRADITVYEAGTENRAWQWSDGRMFTQAIERVRLSPGETFEGEYTWQDPLPGEYTAVATLDADRDVEARTSLTV